MQSSTITMYLPKKLTALEYLNYADAFFNKGIEETTTFEDGILLFQQARDYLSHYLKKTVPADDTKNIYLEKVLATYEHEGVALAYLDKMEQVKLLYREVKKIFPTRASSDILYCSIFFKRHKDCPLLALEQGKAFFKAILEAKNGIDKIDEKNVYALVSLILDTMTNLNKENEYQAVLLLAKFLGDLFKISPPDIKHHATFLQQQAICLIRQKRFEEAILLLNNIIEKYKSFYELYYLVDEAYVRSIYSLKQLKNVEKAKILIKEKVTFNSSVQLKEKFLLDEKQVITLAIDRESLEKKCADLMYKTHAFFKEKRPYESKATAIMLIHYLNILTARPDLEPQDKDHFLYQRAEAYLILALCKNSSKEEKDLFEKAITLIEQIKNADTKWIFYLWPAIAYYLEGNVIIGDKYLARASADPDLFKPKEQLKFYSENLLNKLELIMNNLYDSISLFSEQFNYILFNAAEFLISQYKKIDSLKPRTNFLYFYLSSALLSQNNLPRTYTFLSQAIEAFPLDPTFYLKRSIILKKLSKNELATKDSTYSIELTLLKETPAKIMTESKPITAILPDYKENAVLIQANQEGFLHFEMGRFLYSKKDFSEATKYFNNAIKQFTILLSKEDSLDNIHAHIAELILCSYCYLTVCYHKRDSLKAYKEILTYVNEALRFGAAYKCPYRIWPYVFRANYYLNCDKPNIEGILEDCKIILDKNELIAKSANFFSFLRISIFTETLTALIDNLYKQYKFYRTQNNELSNALALFEKYVQFKLKKETPSSLTALHFELGELLIEKGFSAKALPYLSFVVRHSDSLVEKIKALFKRIDLYKKNNQWTEAWADANWIKTNSLMGSYKAEAKVALATIKTHIEPAVCQTTIPIPTESLSLNITPHSRVPKNSTVHDSKLKKVSRVTSPLAKNRRKKTRIKPIQSAHQKSDYSPSLELLCEEIVSPDHTKFEMDAFPSDLKSENDEPGLKSISAEESLLRKASLAILPQADLNWLHRLAMKFKSIGVELCVGGSAVIKFAGNYFSSDGIDEIDINDIDLFCKTTSDNASKIKSILTELEFNFFTYKEEGVYCNYGGRLPFSLMLSDLTIGYRDKGYVSSDPFYITRQCHLSFAENGYLCLQPSKEFSGTVQGLKKEMKKRIFRMDLPRYEDSMLTCLFARAIYYYYIKLGDIYKKMGVNAQKVLTSETWQENFFLHKLKNSDESKRHANPCYLEMRALIKKKYKIDSDEAEPIWLSCFTHEKATVIRTSFCRALLKDHLQKKEIAWDDQAILITATNMQIILKNFYLKYPIQDEKLYSICLWLLSHSLLFAQEISSEKTLLHWGKQLEDHLCYTSTSSSRGSFGLHRQRRPLPILSDGKDTVKEGVGLTQSI